MRFTSKLIILILIYLSFLQNSFSDNHNIYETLEIIKNDLKTLLREQFIQVQLKLRPHQMNNQILS